QLPLRAGNGRTCEFVRPMANDTDAQGQARLRWVSCRHSGNLGSGTPFWLKFLDPTRSRCGGIVRVTRVLEDESWKICDGSARRFAPDLDWLWRRLDLLAALDLVDQPLELDRRLRAKVGLVHSAQLVADGKQRLGAQANNVVRLFGIVLV